VGNLILHLKNANRDKIVVNHIGFKGQNLKHKDKVVETIYEVNPKAKDLKANL
jgi:hypothetical protein